MPQGILSGEAGMKARFTTRTVISGLAMVVAIAAGGCATPAQAPAAIQPDLSAFVQPYAASLREAGIHSVQAFANGARVRASTHFGDVYVRYPTGLGATSFIVYVDPSAVEVDSDAYTPGERAQYEAALKAVLPAVVRLAKENNALIRQQQILYNN
jgi:hypothetical protein